MSQTPLRCKRRHGHRTAGHVPLHRDVQALQGRAAADAADNAHGHCQCHLGYLTAVEGQTCSASGAKAAGRK